MKTPHPVKFDAVALQAAQVIRGERAHALAKLQLIITEQFGGTAHGRHRFYRLRRSKLCTFRAVGWITCTCLSCSNLLASCDRSGATFFSSFSPRSDTGKISWA